MSGALQGLLAITVPASTPLLLGCMGAIISERSGVLNLGLEGTMAVGALTAFIAAGMTGSPWLGVGAAVIASVAFVSLLAIFSITLKSDQVITGVMVSLLGVALTTYFGRPWTARSVPTFEEFTLPVVGQYLVQIPVVGEPLFTNTAIDFLALGAAPVVWYFLFRTDLGMEITAVGDDPKTADTMSINVTRTRYMCVLLSGLFAGLGGAAVSLAFAKLWTANLINNRGWIAVALVIVSRWNPIRAVLGAYLFGLIYAMQFKAQNIDLGAILPLSTEFASLYDFLFHPVIMSTYPFVITILVLVVTTRKSKKELGAPQALVTPYMREES